MERVIVVDSQGNEKYTFYNDEPFDIQIRYTTKKKIDDAVIGIAIYRDDQTYIYGTNTLIDCAKQVSLDKEGVVELKIKQLPVNAGKYSFDFAFHRPDGFNYDFWREVCEVTIQNKKNEVGVITLPHFWENIWG